MQQHQPAQQQTPPGHESQLTPRADHGETSYVGHGRLRDKGFGQQVPMKRPGQPVAVAPVYVMLASDEASYISGARIPVTGGTPIL
jgi:NAD(P)-dependent dehydrogenase (short-subunit alcohol dehydrogenase family)